MYIECPDCKSCFFVPDDTLPSDLVGFKCGICKKMFKASSVRDGFFIRLFWPLKIFIKNSSKGKLVFLFLLGFSILLVAGFFSLKTYYPAFFAKIVQMDTVKPSIDEVLQFKNLNQKLVGEGDIKVIEITGTIVNTTSSEQIIPAISATLYNDEGKKQESKIVYPSKRTIRFGENVSFRIKILSPDGESKLATLDFVQE